MDTKTKPETKTTDTNQQQLLSNQTPIPINQNAQTANFQLQQKNVLIVEHTTT